MADPSFAIETQRLSKRRPGKDAGFRLREASFGVPTGTVCGLLGPNGAGKTTALRILTTLLDPDGGGAEVAGFNVVTDPARVRERIGLVGQNAALDELLGGRQNLILFGRLYHLTGRQAARRADELLAGFGLTDAASTPVARYSGGMRRRLDLAASLIMEPRVLFVDEPTTGLDPRGRHEVWTAMRRLVGRGVTILLTTQYLEEADQLANQIVMLNQGRVVAQGSPGQLKAEIGGDRLEITLATRDDLAMTREIVARLIPDEMQAELVVDEETNRISAPAADGARLLAEVAAGLTAAAISTSGIALRQPTLDEVFFHLTTDRTPAREEQEAA